MSNFFHGKMFAKISELEESFGPYDSLNLTDEFVVVNDNITKKITGLNLTESIVSIGNLASKAYVDAVVDGAPELLNTLNEIAAALNDDSNFASNIINSIATKLPTANFGLEFWSALEGVNTFHIAEGSNLYYTQARFDAALAAKRTTALAEGDNLYYTEQRVLDVVIPLVPTSIFDLDVPEVSVNLPGYLHYNGTTLSWESSTNPTYDTVTILAEPTSLLHAATKGYVDSQINTIESDRLTNGILEVVLQSDGTLVLPAEPTSDNHAATKGYVDNQITDVVAGQGFATLDYVEDAIETALDAVASQFTTENLNVKNIAFTGTGAVNITSGNDLNFVAAGAITFNGSTLSQVIEAANLDGGTF